MKKIIFSLVALTFMVSACNDDFLDRYPQTEISQEVFFNNEQDLATYIYGLYSFPGVGIYVTDNSTDNAATTGATEIKNMMAGSPSPSTITAGWNWSSLKDINFFMDNFRKAEIEPSLLQHYEGLARFFRARFYMDKVLRYSDVPWYGSVLGTSDDGLYKARDPRTVVIDSIFSDYQFAADHVMESGAMGEVTRWVVLAYMARHALYEGSYRKYHAELGLESSANTYFQMAEAAAEEIMNGPFAIYNTGNPDSDYASLFNSTSLDNNPEIIFANYNTHDVKNSGWWEYMFGNYEVCPSRDLVQAYLMKDGSFYSSQAGFETKEFVDEFANRDPRLSQTYAFPGWELIYTSTYSQGGGIYVQQLQKNFSGYHQIKGFVNSTDPSVGNSLDVPVLRYAETLLIYAEAKAEQGNISQADLDMSVNLLRERAGMPAMTTSPGSDPTQAVKFPGVAPLLLEIRRERRVELALEGFRMDDLMRWAAGAVLEQEPQGLYFGGMGKYDLTGDDVEDIILIPFTQSIPPAEEKEVNSLGETLIYYKAGPVGSDASVYLSDGVNGGTVVTIPDRGVFKAPTYYYRPVPQSEVQLNPSLEQIFGW
jgi:starch-binding outer membrane protein, SusD/RagB family